MPGYQPTYLRSLRLAAVATWADQGLGKPRDRFPIEVDFLERLSRYAPQSFRPLEMPDSSSVVYHREVSHLVDAFDAFPQRVDLAFDSTWKAFETGLHDLLGISGSNTTLGVNDFIASFGVEEFSAMRIVNKGMPQQAAEFLVAKWIATPKEDRLVRRVKAANVGSLALVELRARLREQYDFADPSDRRKAARLLLIAMREERVEVSHIQIELTPADRAVILVSGLLYGLRNERVHGAAPSPFTSSAATLQTFTLPHYAFVTTYFLYMTTARRRGHLGQGIDASALQQNLVANLDSARGFMGRHWTG